MYCSLRASARSFVPATALVVAVACAAAPASAAVARIGTLQVINNSLRGVDIRNSTITSVDIGLNALNAGDLAPNAVGASELAANSVGAAEIASGAVGTLEIADGSVGNADLGSNSVTASKIADDAVGNSELADNSVSASRIAASAVGQSEIATNGVDTAEIDANAVTSSELAAGSVTPDKLTATVGVALTLTGSDSIVNAIPRAIESAAGYAEDYDNAGLYDTGAHPAYMVVTRAGWYHVSGRVQWSLDTIGDPQRRVLSIATSTSSGSDVRYPTQDEERFDETAAPLLQSVDGTVRVAAGDRIWLEALQENPGNESLTVTAPGTGGVRGANFRAAWLGA